MKKYLSNRQRRLYCKLPDKSFYHFCYKFILITIFLSSCSTSQRCQHHTNRLKALNCLKEQSDTTYKIDTLYGWKIDTVVQFHNDIDTLLVDSGGIKIKTIIHWKSKTVQQTVVKDTGYVTSLLITKHVFYPEITNKIPWYIYALIGALVILLFLSLINRK